MKIITDKIKVKKLDNFALGKWIPGEGEGQTLFNAITGNPVAIALSFRNC